MRVKVRSVTDRFRRAGMAFTQAPKEIDVDAKQLAILKAEPQLVVEVVPEETAKPKETEKKPAAPKAQPAPAPKEEKKEKGA